LTIIQIASSFAGGGAPQMILKLAKLSNPTIKTVVVSVSSIENSPDPNTNVNELEPKFKEAGIEYHFLGITSFNFLKNRKSLAASLKKFDDIVKQYPDAVFHCHQHHSALLAIFHRYVYRRKVPFAFTLHTNKVSSVPRRWVLFLTKRFRKADIIFTKSGSKWYLKNTNIIANGVDFKNFKANENRTFSKSKPFSFLYLGRLSREKNPLLLIDTAKELLENGHDNFVIDFVGRGKLKEDLEVLIKSNNLEKHIKLHGFRNDIQNVINNSHCMVIPSYREGLPVVLVEAAASLLPIISTPVGSIPDFINDTNGYISSHKDFGKTMIHVITNYPEAIEKAKKLDADAKDTFDIHNVYKKHLELYQSLASK